MKFQYGLLIICLLIGFQGSAQVKNIRLAELNSSGQVNGLSIVVNPRDPRNWVSAVTADHIYYTVDAGATWQRSQLSNAENMFGGSRLVVNDKGEFFLFHISGKQGNGVVVCRGSKDGGKTWDDGIVIYTAVPKDQQMPGAAIDDKGNLFVTWAQLDMATSQDQNCLSSIQFSTSSNGKKWSKPVELSQTLGNCSNGDNTVAGAMPAVSHDGKVFAGWANQGKLFLDRSFDGGSMWLRNDIAITKQSGGWEQQIPGHGRINSFPVLQLDRAKLSPARGSLFLTWADQRNEGDTDIWFLRSVNFGDYWTSPLNVHNDELGTHQYAPWMAVDQSSGYVYVIYFSQQERESNLTDVYVAYSTDSGNSFKNARINQLSFTPVATATPATFASISVHKGIVAAAWTTSDQAGTVVWACSLKHDELEKITMK